MGWFPYALLATIMLTIINFGDKYVVESAVGHPLAAVMFASWINLLAGLLIWAFSGFVVLPLSDSLLLIVAGTAPGLAGFFYFQSMAQAEASRIVVLLQLTPVYVLILSVLFLGETLSVLQIGGFVLIVAAAVFVSLQRTQSDKMESRGVPASTILWWMLIANLIISVSIVMTASVVERIVVDLQSLMVTIAYEGLGVWLAGMSLYILIPRVRHAFNQRLRMIGPRSYLAVGLVETTFVLRQFVLFTAFSLGSASLITVVGSTSVFFAVVAGWGLTLAWPHIFKEDIRRATLLRKAWWALVAFAGILLIQ